jgi:hypothetical protein
MGMRPMSARHKRSFVSVVTFKFLTIAPRTVAGRSGASVAWQRGARFAGTATRASRHRRSDTRCTAVIRYNPVAGACMKTPCLQTQLHDRVVPLRVEVQA